MQKTTSKKILYIHYGGHIGGAAVSLLYLAQALDKAKYHPIVIFSSEGPILKFFRHAEIEYKVVPFKSVFFYGAHVPISLRMIWKFVIYFIPTISTIRRLILEEKPDLIHLNTSVLIPCAIAAKMMKVPIVWHVREVCGDNRFIRCLMLSAIEHFADKIIAVSETVKAQFNQKRKVVRIYNAVNFDQFDHAFLRQCESIRRELNIPKDAPVVSMVGSIQHPKGHFVLLDAAEIVIKSLPDVVFLIVAGGPPKGYAQSWKGKIKKILRMPFSLFDKFVAEVEKRGLNGNFIFTGFRQDIPRIMAAIDLLVFPVLKPEGFGRPLIEAMAMGKPVIATDIGPSKEIVEDGVTGKLVPPNNVKELAHAIVELLLDKTKAASMGRAGLARAQRLFAMIDNHEQTVKVLNLMFEFMKIS